MVDQISRLVRQQERRQQGCKESRSDGRVVKQLEVEEDLGKL